MKRILFTPALFISSLLFTAVRATAQGSAGLVAHWNFNGNANDITGNGNDGITHNVSSTVGRKGLPNTAYYFNGSTSPSSYSWIEVPYNPDLNVAQYSICATIKVDTFYTGICQINKIFERGIDPIGSDNYYLEFFDNDYDTGNCYSYNPAYEVFAANAGNYNFPYGSWHYTPHVQLHTWTSVVATFNDTDVKIYVNGFLEDIVKISTMIASSTNGISIGKAFGSSVDYPYSFTGSIDDIRLYNRALSPVEVLQYNDSSVLGIESVTQTIPAINIYPNPAKDIINIHNSTINGDLNINIYNTLGQVVESITLKDRQKQLSVANLTPAVYFLYIQAENGQTLSKEFIKQ